MGFGAASFQWNSELGKLIMVQSFSVARYGVMDDKLKEPDAVEKTRRWRGLKGFRVYEMNGPLPDEWTQLAEVTTDYKHPNAPIGEQQGSANVDVPSDASIVNGQGNFLIPGLWDMHMHFSLLGGPSILPLFTANGVTGVRDNGTGDEVFVWQREIAEGIRMGPRIVSSGLAFVGYETPDSDPHGWAQGIVSLDDVAPALHHRSETADFVKIQDGFMPRDRWSAIAAETSSREYPS